jgi:hypothetical protein
MKTILVALYTRVVLAYRSTLIGLALVAADVVVSSLQTAPLPQWVHIVVGVAASILALYKGKQAPALSPVP